MIKNRGVGLTVRVVREGIDATDKDFNGIVLIDTKFFANINDKREINNSRAPGC
jgi:hypothetical protein